MKIKNKLSLLIVLLLSVLFIYSCTTGSTDKTKLSAPHINLTGQRVYWEEVENADRYEILINGTTIDEVDTLFYQITINRVGNYSVQVIAKNSDNEFLDSDISNTVVYQVASSQKLSTPVISLASNIIVWDNIQYASGYEIYINNNKVANTIANSYTLNSLEVGTYQIKIRAYSVNSNYVNSEFSNEITYVKSSEFMTISEVKEAIDAAQGECKVSFVGTVIGYDSLGFAHVADETGAIYVRAKHSYLIPGLTVKVSGTGFIYEGTASHPEYTRQIKSNGIEINLYGGTVTEVHKPFELTKEDLSNTDIQVNFHGNIATVSGIVECGPTKYDYYLNDEEGNHIISIHHYSMNFQNTVDDKEINKFIDLDGQYVTLKGIIYRYNYYNNIWVIQCIGLDNDLIVHTTKLSTPTITLNNNLIEWEFIDNATKYEIYVDDEYYDDTTTNYIDISVLDNSAHTIKIKAIDETGDYANSLLSNEILINSTMQIDDVDFFMINDTHGSIFDGETPGISRVAELIKQLEDKNGDIIKIANGDIFQGSYESNTLRGRVLVESLNVLDFDAFILGNHEFDWGLDEIKKYKDGNPQNGEANYPFLGANIIDKTTNKMVDWLEPYTIVEYSGIQVGIIGVIGSTQESSILATNVQNYDFVDPLSIIESLIAELRTEKGCEVVVVASHDYDELLNYNISRLSGNSRVDTVFCAHTHQEQYDVLTRPDNKQIPVVQNRDKNRSASFVELILDANLDYKTYNYNRYYVSNYNQNKEFNEFLVQYNYLYEESNRVIGYNSNGFNKSFLGKIAVDYMKTKFTADISIMNTGGVRATIPSGDVTIGHVFEAFPFENTVIIVYLTGAEIKSLYNSNGSYLYINSDFDYSSFNNTTKYKVAVIDYVFYGAYYTEFMGKSHENTNVVLRDLLVEYIDNTY